MPSSSTAMTRKTPSSTSPQGSLRLRMPLMTVAIRRACGAAAFSLPMPESTAPQSGRSRASRDICRRPAPASRGVQHDVLALVVDGRGLVRADDGELLDEAGACRCWIVDAGVRRGDVPGLRGGAELLQALCSSACSVKPMAMVETTMPIRKREPLQARRGADQEAGLQILRGVAGFGRGDADHAADGDGQRAEGRSRPAA